MASARPRGPGPAQNRGVEGGDEVEARARGVEDGLRAAQPQPGAVVAVAALGQQPFARELEAAAVAVDAADAGAAARGHQQGQPRAAAQAEQPGAGADLQPLVHRFVERHQHPFLDFRPVAGPRPGRG
ncbi:hypothetical protein GCM10020000_22700 [Streptomyces olivoverticillatus]